MNFNPFQNQFGQTTLYTNPYQNLGQPMQNQATQLIKVQGIDGAKAYQMPPNSVQALFDANNDIMYIKVSDGAGFSTIRMFKFSEIKDETKPTPPPGESYVTKSELETILAEFKENLNGKQSIRKSSAG